METNPKQIRARREFASLLLQCPGASRYNRVRMIRIKFYSKDGCWLCDAAREMLNGLTVRHDLRIENIDITSSDELYETYRFDIPVLEFADGSTLHGHIKKSLLMRKFDDNKE